MSDRTVSDRTVCPHGDRTCPCPDGAACHYEPVLARSGEVLSPASPCTNPACAVCDNDGPRAS